MMYTIYFRNSRMLTEQNLMMKMKLAVNFTRLHGGKNFSTRNLKMSHRLIKHGIGNSHVSTVYSNSFRNFSLSQPKFIHKERRSVKNTLIMYSVYGSMLTGTCIFLYILYDTLKKRSERKKGYERLNTRETGGMRLTKYKGYVLPEIAALNVEDIQTFETSEEDVWLVSYPRSGSTWLQEIVYLIHSNMDMGMATSKTLDERWPYLEFTHSALRPVKELASPRLIKTHLPYTLLPESVRVKKPKIIYIARNPKDVLVSYFYYCQDVFPLSRYKGTFTEFFKQFITEKVPFSPWNRHVLEFWDRRKEENILYITYEDLKQDTYGSIEKIANFLGKEVTPEQKRQIVEHCSFGQMKANPKTNYSWYKDWGVIKQKEVLILRKGCIGDWMNHLSPEMDLQMDEIIFNSFVDTDISFTFKGSQH